MPYMTIYKSFQKIFHANKSSYRCTWIMSNMVLEKGLEPLNLAVLDPKSSVSTNSTIQA